MKMTIIYLMSQAKGLLSDGTVDFKERIGSEKRKEVQKAAEMNRWINVNHIFSSSDKRAHMTAEIFSSVYEKPLFVNESLKSCGDSDDFNDSTNWYDGDDSLNLRASLKICQARVKDAMAALIDRQMGKRLLVCIHPTVLSLYLNTIDTSFDEKKCHNIKALDFFRVIYSNGSLIYRN